MRVETVVGCGVVLLTAVTVSVQTRFSGAQTCEKPAPKQYVAVDDRPGVTALANGDKASVRFDGGSTTLKNDAPVSGRGVSDSERRERQVSGGPRTWSEP